MEDLLLFNIMVSWTLKHLCNASWVGLFYFIPYFRKITFLFFGVHRLNNTLSPKHRVVLATTKLTDSIALGCKGVGGSLVREWAEFWLGFWLGSGL